MKVSYFSLQNKSRKVIFTFLKTIKTSSQIGQLLHLLFKLLLLFCHLSSNWPTSTSLTASANVSLLNLPKPLPRPVCIYIYIYIHISRRIYEDISIKSFLSVLCYSFLHLTDCPPTFSIISDAAILLLPTSCPYCVPTFSVHLTFDLPADMILMTSLSRELILQSCTAPQSLASVYHVPFVLPESTLVILLS